MIILAYPITITLDVNFTDGRASRVHFAAVLGIALMIASLWSLILNQIPQKLIWKNIAVFLKKLSAWSSKPCLISRRGIP